jgi:UDP-N-acetyl-D-mannosaminuronate dehydrogenase
MSPAYGVARELRARGASISYHDSHADDFAVDRRPVPRQTDLESALRDADLAILLQKHHTYSAERLLGAGHARFDARGLLAEQARVGEPVETL